MQLDPKVQRIIDWRESIAVLPDNHFFEIIRMYLGEIKTPFNKQKLIEAVDTDTIVTGQTIKSAVRGLKNKFSEGYQALEFSGKATKEELLKLATGTNKLAAVDGDMEKGMIQAGQSLTPLKKIEPMATIIESLVTEARATLAEAQNINL